LRVFLFLGLKILRFLRADALCLQAENHSMPPFQRLAVLAVLGFAVPGAPHPSPSFRVGAESFVVMPLHSPQLSVIWDSNEEQHGYWESAFQSGQLFLV